MARERVEFVYRNLDSIVCGSGFVLDLDCERLYALGMLPFMKPSTLLSLVLLAQVSGLHAAAPVIIDDAKISKEIGDKIGALISTHKATSAVELEKQLVKKSASIKLPKPGKTKLDDLYGERVGSVGIIASVYKCKHCPNWHRSGCATCWVLTEDGVMVTNYHVFKGKTHDGFGVIMNDGKVAVVKELLAANKDADVVIFRVSKTGYKPIPLGEAEKVGGNVNIIAHPDSRFFTYTSGRVSRYYRDRAKRPCYWMGVTAEYARGSSGGPVMNDTGNVVGMVSSTSSIYYPPRDRSKNKRGPFQMVIRNCVPVDAIRKLINPKK